MIAKLRTRVQSLRNPDLVPFTSSYASTSSPGHIKNDAIHISRESHRFMQLWSISAMVLKPIQSPRPHTAESQILPPSPVPTSPQPPPCQHIPVAEPEQGRVLRQPPCHGSSRFPGFYRTPHGFLRCSQPLRSQSCDDPAPCCGGKICIKAGYCPAAVGRYGDWGVCLIGRVSGYARLYVMEFCESVATAIDFEGDLSSQSWVKQLKIASISHQLSFAKIDLLAKTPAEYAL